MILSKIFKDALFGLIRNNFSDPEFYHSSIMVNASIKILQKNIFLRYWPLEKIKDANARDFRLQYFRKGTLITSGSDPLRKLIFVKNGSCQVIRKVDQTRDRRTGIVQTTQFHRRNVSPTCLPPEISKTVFLREKRLDTGDIYGLEMHFSLENTGRLKYMDHETVDKDLYVVSNGAEVIIISGCSKM